MTIQELKKKINAEMNARQPKTFEEVSAVVRSLVPDRLRWRACNVLFKGYFQGVQIIIYGRKKSHILPCLGGVYAARPVPNSEARYVEN